MTGPADVSAVELAGIVRPHLGTALLALDVDGVLAPLVDHAEDAELPAGARDGLWALAELTTVAIVSGRALDSLERLFGFPDEFHVVGSHGLEVRGAEAPVLDDDEQYTFDQLEIIATRGVAAAGDGAWLEYKPASVVLHTRNADAELASPAVDAVANLARMIDGAQVTPGSAVVELLARAASKGDALLQLAERLERSPIVYLGDDVTDEDAFRTMSDADVSIRVGPGESAAAHRLSGPADVAEFVSLLASPI